LICCCAEERLEASPHMISASSAGFALSRTGPYCDALFENSADYAGAGPKMRKGLAQILEPKALKTRVRERRNSVRNKSGKGEKPQEAAFLYRLAVRVGYLSACDSSYSGPRFGPNRTIRPAAMMGLGCIQQPSPRVQKISFIAN
jgi:hypothetical protein